MAALRTRDFSISTLSGLYVGNRKRGEFFLYIFVVITCGSGDGNNCRHTPLSFVMQPYFHNFECNRSHGKSAMFEGTEYIIECL
jgi:hypothetical protein